MSTTMGAVRATDSESVSQAVVSAVATETASDPLELPPLYGVFDPDALDALCQSTESRGAQSVHVEFRYAGCEVCVTADGAVDVTQTAD